MNSVNDIIKQAEKEIREEDFRDAVEKKKEELRSKKWYHKLFPYKIIIKRMN